MSTTPIEVAIIGAGMSGIAMGIRLKKAGIEDFVIFEKAASLGGTWRENRYPGLTCDVPSFFYSYSFEPNLDWSRRFSPGSEILSYFERTAEKYGLLDHIEFETHVSHARYHEGFWDVETQTGPAGPAYRARTLVLATGPLHHKKYPAIEGIESFKGDAFHTADWKHDVELAGKRIGVVGTGATAVQAVTPLAEVASQLSVFQRTAQWIFPTANAEYSEAQIRRRHRFPFIATLTRALYQYGFELGSNAVTEPGFMRRFLSRKCHEHLATVEDPNLRAKLTPDYEPGCKRLVMSTTFYPTMAQPNVQLETEAIERIEPRGIVTRDGKLHELDVIVYATGFDPHAWGVDNVVGAEGLSLQQAWKNGTRTYKSIALPGFPNLFLLVGPNSPLGNLSIIDVSETQADYIVQCIEELRSGKARSLAPSVAAMETFHRELLDAMPNTLWMTGCNSWYLDEDGVPILWPWPAKRFKAELARPEFADFHVDRTPTAA